MEERNKFLQMLGIAIGIVLVIAGIVAGVLITSTMEEDKGAEYGWKSPSLMFTGGTEMTGASVVDGIKSFSGYAVRFTVKTLDGCVKDYNYDGKDELPTYAGGDKTDPGYINPTGRFYITEEPGEDGKVTHVVITQN